MAMFKLNQEVMSNEDVQGLVRGVVCQVVDIAEYPSMFGTFVTYYLLDPFRQKHAVVNGHLILKAL